jgi:hypothetical protein
VPFAVAPIAQSGLRRRLYGSLASRWITWNSTATNTGGVLTITRNL